MSKDIHVLISNNVKRNVRKNIYTAIDYCIFFLRRKNTIFSYYTYHISMIMIH